MAELAARIGAIADGDQECMIRSVATLQSGGPGDVSFLANPRYRKYLAVTAASAVILRPEDRPACPVGALITENPYLAYARAAALLYPPALHQPGIDAAALVAADCVIDGSAAIGPGAVIEAGAVIGPGTYIGPGCVVGEGARIGEGSRLQANVTVCHGVKIGKRALIHPGVVIGSDGFGIADDEGRWVKVPQLGAVTIGDDVEIGANTTIDRGALEDTVIENGVKLDNQIQIAHNVRIGAHTAIAGCVGIAGSTRIGSHCTIGGGVGIVGHLEIVDHVQITAMSFVTRSVQHPGLYSSGLPLEPNAQWRKTMARLRRLSIFEDRLKALERELKKSGSSRRPAR